MMAENLTRVDMAGYVEDLVTALRRSSKPGDIEVQVDTADVVLTFDAVSPCGLLINELVSNAMKHAFPADWRAAHPETRATIRVALQPEARDTERFMLMVSDNGVGMPSEVLLRQTDALGLTLAGLLAGQLHGELTVAQNAGTTVRVVFSSAVALAP